MLRTIRGATTTQNSKSAIIADTKELLREILLRNNIAVSDISSVIFSATRDLDAAYPAEAARDLGIIEAALICVQEQYVKGSLEKCVRIMLQFNEENNQNGPKHVYLKDALNLRPDLFDKD